MKMRIASVLLACGLLTTAAAQVPNPTQQLNPNQQSGSLPVYTVTVVARTVKAVNYRHRGGSTKVDFRGTALMPEARGKAEVESKRGVIEVKTEMEKLQPATRFGPEYLTYVMWAITPEGRATNIGEVLIDDGKSKLNTTTELQAFGLIVTAEPYFAVTQPSDVVVMENFIRDDTRGTIQNVEAKYELLQRGQYTLNVKPQELRAIRLDSKAPLELHEARNAVQIARWAGAEKYALNSFAKAIRALETAEGRLQDKGGKKNIATPAREATQMAEDARIIAVKKIEEERLANERAAAAEREARARAAAEEQQRLADRARAEAADRTRQAEEESRRRAQAEADRAAAERARLDAERSRQEAQVAAELAGRQKAEAEAARATALAQQLAAQAEADRARQAAELAERQRQQAEQEKAEVRARLLQQLNLILETRESARGLIVNMSDILFDTARYTLRPAAREKLAKIAGIVLAHPGLKLEVEGHTDSVGSDEYNQRLSENRASAVRDYLAAQGIPHPSVTARGFGESMPVVSNDTAAGRQRNRRVELVVSGEPIGTSLGPSAGIRR